MHLYQGTILLQGHKHISVLTPMPRLQEPINFQASVVTRIINYIDTVDPIRPAVSHSVKVPNTLQSNNDYDY
jgi:hypothetical protein